MVETYACDAAMYCAEFPVGPVMREQIGKGANGRDSIKMPRARPLLRSALERPVGSACRNKMIAVKLPLGSSANLTNLS